MCGSRKYPYPPKKISEGEEVGKTAQISGLEIPGGGGGGMDIFWNHTIAEN